jgi:AcrR family transcriptional regulator
VRMSDIAKTAGISRQALYLHFPNRADLLVATTRHIDAVKDIDARLAASRTATGGIERLEAYVAAWGDYIPQIHGVAMALMSLQDHDAEARIAWAGRETAMREGCAAAINALQRDGTLTPALSPNAATDLLWTLLSVRNWDRLVQDCGWSQTRYIAQMQRLARAALVAR